MEKTTTLNTRVNPDVKRSAEEVLSQLGIPMSTAIDMFLRQVTHTQGIPFPLTLPQAPNSVDATRMDADKIRSKIAAGLDSIEKGKVRPAREAFDRPRQAS
ncbi:MAG: type II toxin-antitoxin system RelB/DinJ family antitoxin [Coriobacteriia bacterium]|nr:type II toxin-antitoxin system RelB/DinJ family antitoxin [Coriobacteriia bacterium]